MGTIANLVAVSIFVHFLLIHQAACSSTTRKLASQYNPPAIRFTYHGGALLDGVIPVSLIWYGTFTPAQRSIVHDFLFSLTPRSYSSNLPVPPPTVARWWRPVEELLRMSGRNKRRTEVWLTNQVTDSRCSLGKYLKRPHIALLAARAAPRPGGLAVVLTSADVAVEGFCSSHCGMHSSTRSGPYVWVGNPALQCPGQCAWPFHRPTYGPRGEAPLKPPNGDAGIDGMVTSLAALLAGAVTNPFGTGWFQGDRRAAVEVAAVCPGVYGSGAYPGYPGRLLVDGETGGSYNAHGSNGRKYLLPAMFDSKSSKCLTLV